MARASGTPQARVQELTERAATRRPLPAIPKERPRGLCASDQSWSGRRGYAGLGDVRSPVDAKPDEAAEGAGCGRALSPPRGDSPSRTEPGHRIVGWGTSRGIHPLQALRAHKVVSLVPVAPSSPECAACPFTSPDNRLRQAEFVGQRCGQRDDADHRARSAASPNCFRAIR